MAAKDLIASIVSSLSDIASELVDTLSDPAGRKALLASAGREAPSGPPPAQPNDALTLAQLRNRADQPGAKGLELLVDFANVMTSVVALVEQASEADSLDDAWNITATCFEIIAISRMRVNHLGLVAVLNAAHLVSDNRLLIADAIESGENWGDFLLGHPADDESKADNFSLILSAALAYLGGMIPVVDDGGKEWRTDMLFGWDTEPASPMPRAESALRRMATLRFTHRDPLQVSPVEEVAGFSVAVVPPSSGGWGAFFALQVGAGLKFTVQEDYSLALEADSPSAIQAFFGKNSFVKTGLANTHAKVTAGRKQEATEKLTIGSPGSVHFEVGQLSTGFDFGDPVAFRFLLADAALVIPQSSMGFLGSVLPSGDIKFNVDVDLLVDTEGKLTFAGGAGMTVTLPVNVSLLVLKVRSVTLGLGIESSADETAVSLSAVVAFGLDFGKVFKVGVDSIGGKTRWVLPSSPTPVSESNLPPGVIGRVAPTTHGNLGTLGDLSLDFVPPLGIGVELDTALVKGGGYFYYDPAKRLYAGLLEASLSLPIKTGALGIQIKAAGLLRETDSGWDFVLILSAQFNPPFEIFACLTLNGVGGMFGINVTVDIDKLRSGLRDGAMGRLLFPDDPVANAPAIIATMVAVFPHKQGGLVVGPMLQLGWGRPTPFVLISVAIVVCTKPAMLIIMGRLRVAAPSPALAIVDIKADFLGVIDFDKPAASFDASLVDSRLAAFALTGDMAMRAGGQGVILSIGGFHPRFSPPEGLKAMHRVAIDISANPLVKIRCEAYLAITSNTFQLGIHASLDIDAKVASLRGWLDFDALVQWEPRFHFIVEVSAGLDLRVAGRSLAGVAVALLLEGPGPWHAKGRATLHFLFFTVHVGFEVTWGESSNESAPPEIDAVARVMQALSAPGAWTGVAPSVAGVVTFRDLPPDTIGVHPDGKISVRQQAVPLNIDITRIGRSSVIGDSQKVIIAPVDGAPPAAVTKGLFAASQFMDLSDDEKLSRPSFELFDDGMVFGSDAIAFSAEQVTPGRYETIFVPERREQRRWFDMHATLMASALQTNSVARSGLHAAALFDGPSQKVTVLEPTWLVVSADTLAPLAATPQTFTTAAAAHAAKSATSRSLGAARTVVIDQHEAVT